MTERLVDVCGNCLTVECLNGEMQCENPATAMVVDVNEVRVVQCNGCIAHDNFKEVDP